MIGQNLWLNAFFISASQSSGQGIIFLQEDLKTDNLFDIMANEKIQMLLLGKIERLRFGDEEICGIIANQESIPNDLNEGYLYFFISDANMLHKVYKCKVCVAIEKRESEFSGIPSLKIVMLDEYLAELMQAGFNNYFIDQIIEYNETVASTSLAMTYGKACGMSPPSPTMK